MSLLSLPIRRKHGSQKRIHALAIISVFAPIDFTHNQEERVASIVRARLPHLNIVCSRDVAHIGLLERENAAILNASLLTYAKKTVSGFQKAARALHLRCPVFITSNDGTLLSCAQATKLPIRTLYVPVITRASDRISDHND